MLHGVTSFIIYMIDYSYGLVLKNTGVFQNLITYSTLRNNLVIFT